MVSVGICDRDYESSLLYGSGSEHGSGSMEKYKEYLEKRRNHIPLQHITGSQEFMGLEFLVNEHVLIPRQDTEVLVEEALEMMKQETFRSKDCLQLLDMCTGSGCILLSVMHYAEQKGIFIEGTGVDFSEQALMVAQKNEKHLRSTKKDEKGKVNWILSDLLKMSVKLMI